MSNKIYTCKIGNDITIEVDAEKEPVGRFYYPISGYQGTYTIESIAKFALLESGIRTPFLQEKPIIKRVEVFKGEKSKGVFKLACPEEIPSNEVFQTHINEILSKTHGPVPEFIKKWILSDRVRSYDEDFTNKSDYIRGLQECVKDIYEVIRYFNMN